MIFLRRRGRREMCVVFVFEKKDYTVVVYVCRLFLYEFFFKATFTIQLQFHIVVQHVPHNSLTVRTQFRWVQAFLPGPSYCHD
jgi:hypothetical protein